jgi:hypothetical protein
MKARAKVRAKGKKTQPDSTHRGIFLTGRLMGRTAVSAGQPEMWRHLLVK